MIYYIQNDLLHTEMYDLLYTENSKRIDFECYSNRKMLMMVVDCCGLNGKCLSWVHVFERSVQLVALFRVAIGSVGGIALLEKESH